MSRGFLKMLLLFWIFAGRSSDEAHAEDKQTLAARYNAFRAIANGYDKSGGPMDVGKYGSEDIVRMILEEKDRVVCGFSFVALSYMRISKHLLVWNGQDRLDLAVGQIESFGDHAFGMIVVLYNLGYQSSMMGIWYFYIYSRKIAAFLGQIRKDRRRQNDCKPITTELYRIHDNVVDELSHTVKQCKLNRHDIASRHHGLNERYRCLSKSNASDRAVIAVIEQYKSTVDPLISDNQTLKHGRNNANQLAIDRMYLNGVVGNRDLMNELQTVYDPKIVWGDAADVLQSAHDDLTDNAGIIFDKLAEFQRFQSLFKDFLLTIVLRFAWSHLFVTGHQIIRFVGLYNVLWVERENQEFLTVLVPFLKFLALDDHPGLTDLRDCLNYRSWLCLKYGTGIAIVLKELAGIGKNFNGFDPTKSVLGTESEISDNYDQLISFSRINKLRNDYRSKYIREMSTLKKNYTRLFVFINRVQHQILQYVDFGFMNALFSSTCQTTQDKLKSSMFPPEKIDDTNDEKYIEISVKKKDTGKIENIGYENVENPDTMSNKTKSIEPKKSEVPLIQREDSSSGSLEKLSLEQFSGFIQENVNDGIILKESSEKELLKIEDRQNVKVGNINVKSSSSSSEEKKDEIKNTNNIIINEPEGEWKEHTEIINVEIETTKKKLNENSSKDSEKRYLEKFPRLVDESPDEDRKSSRETSQSDTIKIEDNENKNILNLIQEDIGSVELRDATDVKYVSDEKDTINQNEENVARSVNITDTLSSIPDVGEENRFDHIYQNSETTKENTLLTGVRSRGISDEEADAETQSEIVSIFLENIAKSKNNDYEEQSRLKLDDLLKSDHNEKGFAEEKNKPNYDLPVEISAKCDVSNKVESTDVASSEHPLNDNPDSIHTWMELYENSGIFESTQYNDKSEESSEVQSEEIQYDNNAEEYVSSSDENPIILGSKDTQADVEERGYAKEDDSEELKFLARGNIKLEKKTDFGNVDTDVPKEMQVSHVKHNDTERTRLHEKKTRSIDLTDIQNVQGLHNIFSDKENNVKVEDTNSEDKNKRKDIETTHTSDYIPTLIGMKYVPQTESKNKGHEIHEHIPKQVKSDEYNYFEISDSSSVKIKELLPESSPKMGKGTVLEPDSSAINEHVPMQAKSDEYISSEISDSSSVEKEEPLPKPSPKVVKDTLDEIVTVSTQPSFSIAQNSSSSSSATSSLELPPTNQVDWENLPTKFYNSLFENQEYFWSIDEYKKKVESSSSNSD